MFAEQLTHVRQRILHACLRVGRAPSDITLIGVTKGCPASVIEEACAHGLTEIGENRVQEAHEKQEALGSRFKVFRWHLIGHLQRNKAKLAVELFDVIHSVDSAALIEGLEQQLAARGQIKPVLLQVNVSGEATKFGCAPDAALPLARAIQQCPHLQLGGLMTMAPFSDDPEASRPHFRRLRELRDTLQHELRTGPPSHLATESLRLSMGMSQDFEVAIEEGADYIRLGTALFGARA